MNKWSVILLFLGLAAAQTSMAEDAAKAKSKKPKTTAAAPVSAEKPPQGANKADRLDLDTTVVTGNRELPKVLYIVPWKKSEIGELPAQPFNTLLDEMLQPVDREVFKREVQYYQTVSTGVDASKPGAVPPATTAPTAPK
jgi:hypothetical protein